MIETSLEDALMKIHISKDFGGINMPVALVQIIHLVYRALANPPVRSLTSYKFIFCFSTRVPPFAFQGFLCSA